MALTSKTFRIFVSSTFSDLEEERNALQENVFPELRKLCMQHGFRFQAIDLRWGVSKEASLSQETMRICLQEIKRCQEITPKPNFIILLGDRYGWQPTPEEIPENEFKQIKEVIKKQKKDFDGIAEEVSGFNAEELLDNWYKEDKNAVPPVHILQPVDPDSKYNDSKLWDKEVQQPLLHILREAIKELHLSYEERLKYEASATHQEIELGAMRVDDADEHVFGFFRQIKNLDELKKEDLSEQPAKDFVDTDVEDKFDESSYEKLKSLKERLREKLGKDNVISCDAEWQGNGITTDHLDKLCKDVYDSLFDIIRKQIDQMDEKKPLEKEIDAHEDFREDRAKHFIGRVEMLEKIKKYIKEENNYPLAIHGKSGTGKSALLAFAVKKANEDFPNVAIVFRSIGATPTSSDGRSLLESLCRQVSRIYEADESDIPGDYEELIDEFPKRLALATSEKPLILFIDALDQLSDANNARNLTWLLPDLPANVKLIISTLPGECYEALERKLPERNLRELKPMPPEEGEELLNVWLDDTQRTLQPKQRKEILDNFDRKDNGNPLYLKLAFEEARKWKSYTKEEETKLSPDISGIIQNLFKRLSLKENHGEMMVSRSLGYLAASKNGLSEDELLDVLSSDEEFFQDFLDRAYHKPPKNRLPVIVWSRLYFDLEPYLIERSADSASLMTFYHPTTFGKEVKENYLSGKTKPLRHQGLSDYFENQKLYIERDDKKTTNLRKLSELPFQQTYSKRWEKLYTTLTDTEFLEQKNTHFIVFDLLDDFRIALREMPEEDEIVKHCNALQAFTKTLDQASFVLKENPELTFPQIYNRLQWQAEEKEFLKRKLDFERKQFKKPWFCLLSKPAQSTNLIRVFSGHTDWVSACAFSPDGTRIVSGSFDNTLKLWDTESGKELATLKGHTDRVGACIFCPDGRRIVSASDDRTLKLWDAETYKKLDTFRTHSGIVKACASKRVLYLEIIFATPHSKGLLLVIPDKRGKKTLEHIIGHFDEMRDCAFSPDGRRIIIAGGLFSLTLWDAKSKDKLCDMDIPGGYDDDYLVNCCDFSPDGSRIVSGINEELRLWDGETGEELFILKGHNGLVNACAFSPDGKHIVSASMDKTLRLWDAEPKEDIVYLKGHTNWVSACAFSPDGKHIVSSGMGSTNAETLMLWDAEKKNLLASLEGHTMAANDCAFSPDGKFIASTGKTTIRLWDAETYEELSTFKDYKSHDEAVNSCAFSPDSKYLVSASSDKTLKLWDVETKKELLKFEGHTKWVSCCSFNPDGKRIVSGSEDTTLKLWDVATGEEFSTLKGHTGRVNSCVFSPDSRYIASASSDCTLKLWDAVTGEELSTLRGHSEGVNSCSFSPDGRHIVSASEDETLKLWDVRTGKEPAILKGYTAGLADCSFSPDGRRIVIGDDQGQLILLFIENFELFP